ncbi:hypothetical protein GQ457_01G017450 [Hibiscus cannabinus]
MAIADSLEHGEWLSFFKRDLRPFEQHQLGELHCVVGVWRLLSIVPDRLIWEPAVHGGFSIKELSSLMHSFGLSSDVVGAFRVWDLGVPPKIQCFLWFVLLECLPTLAMLSARGVALGEVSLACVFGAQFIDQGFGSFFTCLHRQWWLVSCAAVLWLAINEVIFRGKISELVDLCFLVKLRSFYWVKADTLDIFMDESQWCCCSLDCSFSVAKRAVRRGVEWCPPMAGSWKFNVDGSARGKPGPTGCGGVLRDGDGRIIALFSGSFGVLDSNVAALRVIAFALDVFVAGRWEGVSSFIIESDSTVAISWILHKERRPWRLGRWFRDFDGACLSLPCVCFSHVLREANGMTNV